MGRYHYWRLHPFSLDERPAGVTPDQALTRLLTVGGFPEPFLDNDEREARRWRRERFDRVLREDVRDLAAIRDIQTLGLFLDLLRRRVGGTVVLSNLAADLHVTYKTVKAWIEALERMYLLFAVRPYTRSLPWAVRNPPKVYFFDNSDVVGDPGARLENLVATHLLKRIQFLEDQDSFRYELNYLRDKEGREVNLVVVCAGEIEELVEVKTGGFAPPSQPALLHRPTASATSRADRGRPGPALRPRRDPGDRPDLPLLRCAALGVADRHHGERVKDYLPASTDSILALSAASSHGLRTTWWAMRLPNASRTIAVSGNPVSRMRVASGARERARSSSVRPFIPGIFSSLITTSTCSLASLRMASSPACAANNSRSGAHNRRNRALMMLRSSSTIRTT